MKVKVTKELVIITECSCINEGEVCVNECLFQLPECFDDLSVTAAFNNIPVPVINGKCNIPSLKKGTAVLGVYAYKENEDGIELMYSPKPTAFFVNAGSYSDESAVESIPTISEFEQFCKSYAQDIIEIITSGGNSELFGKIEKTENKTNKIDVQSTDEQYPSAKAVYDFVKTEGSSFSVVENPKVYELADGCYYSSGFVSIDSDAGFYVYDKSLLFVATDEENTETKHFVLFLNCANGIPYDVVNGTTDGISSEWHGGESQSNKVEKIDNTSTHEQYPSAKAVYDAVENVVTATVIVDNDYDPDSPDAQSGIAVAQAIEQALLGSSGGGISSTAVNLLIEILQTAIYSTNISGKIESLQEALLSGGDDSGDEPANPDEPDEPTATDDVTVTDGIMTIISVGSEISVTDNIMTIL